MDPSSQLQYSSETNGQHNKAWRNIWSGIRFFGSVLILVLVINSFGFQSYEVFGQSMHPTLNQGDRLLISKVAKSISRVSRQDYMPERGEIVVFHDPRQSSLQLIKRVIALPNERVIVQDGNLTVYNSKNPDGFSPDAELGLQLDTNYTAGNLDVTVPDGHIFVAGDNRNAGGSLDSRNELGTVPSSLVVGRLVLRIFPISELSWF